MRLFFSVFVLGITISIHSVVAQEPAAQPIETQLMDIKATIVQKEKEIMALEHEFQNFKASSREPEAIMTEVNKRQQDIAELVVKKELLEVMLANQVQSLVPASGR